jgi:predicted metal-dependent peptidase
MTNGTQVTARKVISEGCFYETFNLRKIQDDTYEKVYERLNKEAQKNSKGQGKGQGQGELIDVHEWEPKKGEDGQENTSRNKEHADMGLRELVNTAINSSAKDFGDLPADVRDYITTALRPKVKWNKLLRIHGQNAVKNHYVYTNKKISRRYGFPYPGRRKYKGGVVVAAVDMSGSVSDEYKKQFLGELKAMSKYVDLHILTFDTRIIEHFKEWSNNVKLKNTNGGTDPNCVYEECLQIKPDKVVILTDGYFGSLDTKGFDTLFIITPDGDERTEGKCIRIS